MLRYTCNNTHLPLRGWCRIEQVVRELTVQGGGWLKLQRTSQLGSHPAKRDISIGWMDIET